MRVMRAYRYSGGGNMVSSKRKHGNKRLVLFEPHRVQKKPRTKSHKAKYDSRYSPASSPTTDRKAPNPITTNPDMDGIDGISAI
ncbi:hypothetical protein DPF_1845 [Desulfoplanes formicivorans]|uniref:Uncharacterized protein n=1 Tax=Desulfoplanes formicivorans TaxID=1592317 RepID=A0A194AIR3_9BACT|nr:hypothetical protein DPF_1845 [Desulfoplanes formicivorans]